MVLAHTEGVLIRTLQRGLRDSNQSNKQIHHKVTSELQGPNVSPTRYWGTVCTSGLRTIGHDCHALEATHTCL